MTSESAMSAVRTSISATAHNANVLKIRPPLVFGEEHVDRFLTELEGALKAVMAVT
jgi:4-aminobutyrate aminotransferase-like enzyme